MAQLDQQETTATTPDATVADVHLAHLHKMSRTAGLGTTEYVAINLWAVVALFVGIGSSLALLSNILLVIPVAGVLFALISLVQIGRSNGTQGGKLLAWGGLLLSLLFAGIVGGSAIRNVLQQQQDRREIDAAIRQFSGYVTSKNFEGAWSMCSSTFQSKIPRARFEQRLAQVQKHPVLGDLKEVTWNGRINYGVEAEKPVCAILFDFTYATGAPTRIGAAFSSENGEWKIEIVQEIFAPDPSEIPAPQPPQQPSGLQIPPTPGN